jgi:multiple sugar transport system ATP-binding protein
MASLTLENVSKAFGAAEVIAGPPRDRGRRVRGLRRPVGCGKSTLLRLIAGLEETSGGDIRIDGQSVVRTAAADRGVAMVFQSYALYPHMTVRENLSFGLENMRMKKDEIAKRVDHAAKLLQIDALLERKPASSPAASASGWRSAGRSRATRRSSSSTSRCRTSTRSCA